jgi:hypothetical protein
MPEPAIEERVAKLEGRVSGFEEHFSAIYARFEAVDRRFESLERRVNDGFDALDQKVSRYFVWLVGMQVSVLLAVVAALVGR